MKIINYRIAKFKIPISLLRLTLPIRTIHKLSFILILTLVICSSGPAQQWHLANGSAGNPIAAIDIYRSDPDTMFAIGIYGMIRSKDNGHNWDSLGTLNTDIGALKVDPYNSKLLYASVFGHDYESNDIDMSTDGGLTWNLVFIGRVSPAPVIEIDPQDHNTVYVAVGPGNIRRTTDQGHTWDTITEPPSAYSLSECTSLKIANSNHSIIYAGYTTGIFKSTDKGNSWQTLNLGFAIHSGTFLAVNPNSADIVYAAIFPSSNYSGGVFKSVDGGQTWQEVNNGLSNQDKQILSITINPKNPDQLFIGLYGYGTKKKLCLQTTNGGNQWTDLSEGLPDSGMVNCIAIDTINEKIYIGVNSGSGYSLDLAGIYFRDNVTNVKNSLSNRPNNFQLSQNYPNPFNPSTTIQYYVPVYSRVKIVILDVLGRKIQTLVDEDKRPGSHIVKLNAYYLPSGVYIYQLRSNGYITSKKMVLLK